MLQLIIAILIAISFTGVGLLIGKYIFKTKITGSTSDGYHTFDELYYYRLLYNSGVVNLIQYINDNNLGKLDIKVYKSYRHDDKKFCFGGGWFIVQMETPYGQISNHYENKYWNLFNCTELPYARKFDGHTPAQAAERLYKLIGYIIKQNKQYGQYGQYFDCNIPRKDYPSDGIQVK